MKKGKTKLSKSQLTSTDIENFKSMLLAKRNEILSNVLSIEAEALRSEKTELSSVPIHMADLGTDNYDIENTIGLMECERKLLMEIDDALARIEEGTYGICEGSDEPISKERLKAIPWTRYCVAYADLLEKGFVGKEEDFDQTAFEDLIDKYEDYKLYPFEE